MRPEERDADEPIHRLRQTERLRLEPIRRDHAGELWRLHQDERVAAYWGRWTRDDAARFARACEEAWESQSVSKWIAYSRADGELVGRGGLSRAIVDGAMRLEAGWTLRESCWGHGYATEIGRAAFAFAFDELDADEVVAFTETNNVRSRGVMERLGMTDPREIDHHGDRFVLYTITRDRKGVTRRRGPSRRG